MMPVRKQIQRQGSVGPRSLTEQGQAGFGEKTAHLTLRFLYQIAWEGRGKPRAAALPGRGEAGRAVRETQGKRTGKKQLSFQNGRASWRGVHGHKTQG